MHPDKQGGPAKQGLRRIGSALAFALLMVVLILWKIFVSAPNDFEKGKTVDVPKAATLQEVAVLLKNENIIRSRVFFTHYVVFFRGEKTVTAGKYYFGDSTSALGIASRLRRGDYRLPSIKITIPEGTSVEEIAALIKEKIPNINVADFIAFGKAEEGFLFPDTYFVTSITTAQELVGILRDNFDEKIKEISPDLENKTVSLEDIITMASIVEEEARLTETRKIVAGILWKRLKLGMPLQVDASFRYINGKTSAELTHDDLAIDSPYNTYKYAGLPPTPITNPGLDSIDAAINPIETDYFYFLTGHDGVMYYAETFDEHKLNKEKYL
ncbi:MAG: hypothetical protein A2928_01275 [Candidatus Taylorbacteria bacterium RIFCSPLOWO2_01_FULL_45_15b]|uniref:Endolytic murein transglycosylase n=1 Tax=Candidatus Taylorbacteria bacterium RIFCSPLOWO2_01_FULL_45_15b TaxID=1802319 RepID=A0A1G2NC15_9BACT|nr:MAG: hypothetical protein A2928_01275 [Candidatus Taylorbacteria bacterium RIFCSPLOWO2_01_FULL_45_15b]